jgi:hypothetical protein
MLVRNVATGVQEHAPNNETIRSLVKLGLLEILQHDTGEFVTTGNGALIPKGDPPAVPTWEVNMVRVVRALREGTGESLFPAIVFRVGASVYERFCGEPEHAHQAFGKRTVPHSVLKEYATLYKAHRKRG